MSHVVSSHNHVMDESFGSHVFVSHGHVHVSHDHVQVANIVRHIKCDDVGVTEKGFHKLGQK